MVNAIGLMRMNADPHRFHRELRSGRIISQRAQAVLKLLRWRDLAPWWWDPLAGVLVGAFAVGLRHAVMGFDYRLTYVIFFPFIALVSLLGRPAMGAVIIVITSVYVRWILSWHDHPTPLSHILAYVASGGAIIAIGDSLMRTLAAAEAERKHAQSRESFYALLVGSSNDAIITKTLDGIITGWNPAAVRVLGYEEHEAIGQRIDILFPPDRGAEERQVMQKIIRGEAVEHFLSVRKTKSGALIDVSLTISPLFDETGTIVGASKILRDVTQAKQTADALRVSEERLRFALQGAKAGTWQRDYQTGFYDWSPRFYEMHGLDPGAVPPSFDAWSERVFEEDRERAVRGIKAALEGSASEYYSNYRVRAAAGETRWVEVYGKIERRSDGSIRRTTGISLDVTERHRGLEALTLANDNLRRANESLNRFSSIAAHDLQEPLRKVEQFGDLLQQEYAGQLEGDGAFYLKVMRDSARRMRALINALLNFSRAANRELTMAPVDMNQVMQHVLVACARAIEESGAQIVIENLPTLRGDADLVTQLFQNLVSNAIKYAKSGERPAIHVGAASVWDESPVIFVADEGVGIGGEHHAVIFEPFTRLNPREKVKGTGIGLAFCRTVCERHGWRLEVKSERDHGAVFSVAAPRNGESNRREAGKPHDYAGGRR